MKIAIITFHASDNCGSQLQTYALSKVIQEHIGETTDVIDYSNIHQQEVYATFRKIHSVKDLVRNLYRLLFLHWLKPYHQSFRDFISHHVHLTNVRYSLPEELKTLDGKYDVYIAGSDQVWNTKCYDFDDSYFLDFVTRGRKIAYATSLGATNIIESSCDKIKYTKLLNEFSMLSVREKNAQLLLQTITDKPIELLLDPTLLLSKSDWDDLAGEEPLIKGKYIFYYAFTYAENPNRIVKKLSEKYNMPVYIVDAKAWALRRMFMDGFKLAPQFGPKAFLNLIKYSELVLTTSFHGTALSVAMEKKFWFVKTPMLNPRDDRAITLLNQLGMLDRLQGADYLLSHDVFMPMERTVSADELKQKSIRYLSQALVVSKQDEL